jgi:4-amino-4-deoxy-L-arabinose transferase-like glycosyltransferase
MTPVLDSKPRFLGLAPAGAAILLIAVTTAFRLFYGMWLPLLPDEAYYFQWARHLDASFISKGPAVAYTIAAGTGLFGANNLGIRFFAVMLSAGTAWQVFLLARRWYDDVTGLIAVLIAGVVPLYAIGSVVMTIDPLSVFFWVWAANLFSRALQKGRSRDWALTGFAVGSGFLAKYLNALELVSFLAFLLVMPDRRRLVAQPGFWLMLLVTAICTTPVFWWNGEHGWISFGQLMNRGQLSSPGPFVIKASTFLNFIAMQAVVISPMLFVALLASIGISFARKFHRRDGSQNEGEILLFILFVPVFALYAILSWHLRCEPNWPAVSYLSLLIILASHWRKMLLSRKRSQPFIILAFTLAWLQTLLMHDTTPLHLPQREDPMGRVAGWRQIAERLDDLRQREHADVLIADAYKEAGIFSYYLPDQDFVFTRRHQPAANQYDLWPGYPTDRTALWITGDPTPIALQREFSTITWLERDRVFFHDKPFREYDVYRCENKPQP